MRACIQWLALAPLLVFAGCSTSRTPLPTPRTDSALSGADLSVAEAMAHYSQALISDNTLGDYQSGRSHYRQAAAWDRSNLPLNLKVALDYLACKDYSNAVSVLEQAGRHNPQSVDVQLLLGSTYQALGASYTSDAIRAFRKAAGLAPDRPDAYVRLASLYVIRLKPRKALAVIDDGLRAVKDPNPLLDLCGAVGRIYLAGKDVSAAIRMFEPVFKSGVGHEDTCELLGQCYVSLGKNREAVRVFKALLKRKPGNSQYAMQLGGAYEQLGEGELAMAAYQLASTATPPEPLAVLRLANLEMMSDPARGLTTLEEAVRTFPSDLRVHLFLALTYMRLERADDAVKQFDWVALALSRDPDVAKTIQPLFYFWYGQACERAGRYEEAERLIRQYLASAPKSGEALNYLAYMWADQGRNLDQALVYVTMALKTDPENGAYMDTLGWIYYKKGESAAAIKPLTMALKREGESGTILDHLGDAWAAAGDPVKARAFWGRSLKVDPSNQSVRAKLFRGGVAPETVPSGTERKPKRTVGGFPL